MRNVVGFLVGVGEILFLNMSVSATTGVLKTEALLSAGASMEMIIRGILASS